MGRRYEDRRVPHGKWHTKEKAVLRREHMRRLRRRANQAIRSKEPAELDAIAVPEPYKTSGWLTW